MFELAVAIENRDIYFFLAISSQIVYDAEDEHEDHPMPLEDFMKEIKSHWIERVTFTRNSNSFSVKVSSLPPIIAPKLAGPVIWNSELKKKSAYLGDGKNKVKGKLHSLYGHFANIQLSYHATSLHCIISCVYRSLL